MAAAAAAAASNPFAANLFGGAESNPAANHFANWWPAAVASLTNYFNPAARFNSAAAAFQLAAVVNYHQQFAYQQRYSPSLLPNMMWPPNMAMAAAAAAAAQPPPTGGPSGAHSSSSVSSVSSNASSSASPFSAASSSAGSTGGGKMQPHHHPNHFSPAAAGPASASFPHQNGHLSSHHNSKSASKYVLVLLNKTFYQIIYLYHTIYNIY